MSSRGNVGSFLLAKTQAKSVRQRHVTGNQYNKRKHFSFNQNFHYLNKRINGKQSHGQFGLKAQMAGTDYYKHLPGDIQRRPDYDFTLGPDGSGERNGERDVERIDGVKFAWNKRNDLQLYQMSKAGKEIFNCYRCGYPISSKLVAIKCDNWDWRMCYNCYCSVVRSGGRS